MFVYYIAKVKYKLKLTTEGRVSNIRIPLFYCVIYNNQRWEQLKYPLTDEWINKM